MDPRRLAAVLAADVVGYSRLVSDNEKGALAALHSLRHDVIAPNITAYSGRLFKEWVTDFYAEFTSAVHADQRCAVAIQKDVEAIAITQEMEADAAPNWHALHLGDPIRDVSTLFNDLVGLPNQRRRQGDPESLRCLKVHGQFKADRLLHREFTWLGTFEDFGNISGRSTLHISETGTIGYKPAIADVSYSFPNRGQPILGA